jgi:multiple sugar transport system permease protein/putative aldouronate transport system permease protein
MKKRTRKAFIQGDRMFYIIVYAFLTVFFLTTLYPLIYVVSVSISSVEAAAEGRVWLFPVGFSLEGYKMVFNNAKVGWGFYNSVIYTIFGTAINLSMTLITAFVLSRRELMGRSILNFMFVFTMWFSGGMIPLYLQVRNLGLLNTRWALWLPIALNVWNMIITRTFIASSIPEDLFEAASIEGCGYFRYFLKIVIPLSGPIIAVMCLFYGIDHWNAYFRPLIYISKQELMPLQIVLRNILVANEISAEDLMSDMMTAANFGRIELLKYALIIVSCLPLWIAYPFIQRSFVKGVMVGAIKG